MRQSNAWLLGATVAFYGIEAVSSNGVLRLGNQINSNDESSTELRDDNKPTRPTVIVDLRDTFLPITTKIAAQACSGLYNRLEHDTAATTLPQVYTLFEGQVDEAWLKDLGIAPTHHHWWNPSGKDQPLVSGFDFVNRCLLDFPRWVKYRYYGPARRVVPNALTVAAVLDAVPLIEGDYAFDTIPLDSVELVFDAVTHTSFSAWDAREATEFVYDTFGSRTSTMAKVNPGYDTTVKPTKENEYEPPLVKDMDVSLIDYMFSRRLFVFYLYYGCVKWYYPSYHGDSYELVKRMSSERASGAWPNPIPVFGYDDSWNVMGGDLYEAETMCVGTHNLGQIATESVTNLSFLTRMLPEVRPGEIDIVPNFSQVDNVQILNVANSESNIDTLFEQSRRELDESHKVVYDANKTYVALVVGDGDNVAYIKSSRADWMRDRMDHCKDPTLCFPLTWTISPHLATVAPDLLRWYVKQIKTGHGSTMMDTFVLPPSGHLYAYPGMMPNDVQEEFVNATELDAIVLNTTGVVDWEWFSFWRTTEKNFYPKYTKRGIIRGIFTVNVPYLIPTGRFLPNQYFKIISPSNDDGKPVVMFRPREWRGTPLETPRAAIPIGGGKDYLSAYDMADEFRNYPRGTVTYLYMTSDGGLNYHDIAHLASNVTGSHVELVSTELATALAFASNGFSSTS